MIKIGIVYFSVTDVTGKLVRAVCEELTEQKVLFISHQIVGAEIIEGRFVNKKLMNELHNCDAIVFASPTYMGNVSAQFKAFADATSDFWEDQIWAGKIAAGKDENCAVDHGGGAFSGHYGMGTHLHCRGSRSGANGALRLPDHGRSLPAN